MSLIASLKSAFQGWERFLTDSPEERLVVARLADGWSVKDVVAHLMAWQEISIARLEAALKDQQPKLPAWLGAADPFYAEEHTAEFNARIVDQHRKEPWRNVHEAWRRGFLRFLELAEDIPEERMVDSDRYAWLRGYALAQVLSGSCEHHVEHLEECSKAGK